jgi:cell division protein FtsB
LTRLAHVYKQLNAAVGAFGLDSLSVGTAAVASNDPGDARFIQLEAQLKSLTDERGALAHQMIGLLNGAAFHDREFEAEQAESLSQRGEQLLGEMADLAANP